MSDIKNLLEKIRKFNVERDWDQFHNHKDLAISLALEAAEVLEHFQWKSLSESEDYAKEHKEQISEELGDVFLYLLQIADKLDIDLIKAAEDKIEKNAKKYPVEKSKGKATKYNQL